MQKWKEWGIGVLILSCGLFNLQPFSNVYGKDLPIRTFLKAEQPKPLVIQIEGKKELPKTVDTQFAAIKTITKWNDELVDYFLNECEYYHILPLNALAVASVESGFKFNVIHYNTNGTKDAGLFQINDGTYPAVVRLLKQKKYYFSSWNRTYPFFGISAGLVWLNYLQEKHNYSSQELFTAYNRGEGGLKILSSRSGSSQSPYSIKVLRAKLQLQQLLNK